jgi:hypothetical protein
MFKEGLRDPCGLDRVLAVSSALSIPHCHRLLNILSYLRNLPYLSIPRYDYIGYRFNNYILVSEKGLDF